MAENFNSPIGIRSESGEQTWSLTVNEDGIFELRANSPVGEGNLRLTVDDDSGLLTVGTTADPVTMRVIGTLRVADASGTDGTDRVNLSATGQRLEVMNEDGEIIGMIGGAGNIRAGTNGEVGNLFLYPRSATNIFDNSDATVRLDAASGDMNLGGNLTNGDVFLRDGDGRTRARMSAAGQRLEVMNEDGEIIGMIGGAGNIRAGTNGESGDLFLYPDTATNIFDNGQATISMSGNTGDIVLRNADFAEDFNIAAAEKLTAKAGDVMVLCDDGTLARCTEAYDTKVVGVISGAGGYQPGIIMDKRDASGDRLPIALVGKVYCAVDAAHGSVAIGDLLTTSPTPGCAMRAGDKVRAVGAILGKALAAHNAGTGLIPVLVNLQ